MLLLCHNIPVREEPFVLTQFSYPILGAWLGTVLISCAHFQGHPPWPSIHHLTFLLTNSISTLAQFPFLPAHHFTVCAFFTPRLESDTEHIYSWVYGYGTSPFLLVKCFCIFLCVCVLHSSAHPYHSTGNIVLSPSYLTCITQSIWYFILL